MVPCVLRATEAARAYAKRATRWNRLHGLRWPLSEAAHTRSNVIVACCIPEAVQHATHLTPEPNARSHRVEYAARSRRDGLRYERSFGRRSNAVITPATIQSSRP